jgi:hypothetical protein
MSLIKEMPQHTGEMYLITDSDYDYDYDDDADDEGVYIAARGMAPRTTCL